MKRTHIIISLLILVISIHLSGCGGGSPYKDRADAIRALFESAYPDSGPGAAVLVAIGDTIVLREAYGHADLQNDIALTPEHIFRIATLTKQFTAVGILLLVQSGALSLDDPITAYLPDYPMGPDTITIEHLLTHSSGIPSYTDMQKFWKQAMQDLSHREIIDLFKNEELLFQPGQDWSYSNSGYYLLGLIIEKVSGKSFEQYVEHEILRPLGIKSTGQDACCRIIPERAVGYIRRGTKIEHDTYISMTSPYSAGGMYSTVDDMYRFDRSLYSDTLLTDTWRNRLFETVTFDKDQTANTAYGWGTFPVRGKDAHINVGYINGFIVSSVRIPEVELYIVILSNIVRNIPSPRILARKTAAILLGDPYPDWEASHVTPETLERYTGVYRSDMDYPTVVEPKGDILTIQHAGGALLSLVPTAPDTFFYPNTLSYIVFKADSAGEFSQLVLNYDEKKYHLRRTSEPIPDEPQVHAIPRISLEKCLGTYSFMPGFDLVVYIDVLSKKEGEHRFGIVTSLQYTAYRRVERIMMRLAGSASLELRARSDSILTSTDGAYELTFGDEKNGYWQEVTLRHPSGKMEGKRKEAYGLVISEGSMKDPS